MDLEVNYAHLIGSHAFSARALVTYQPTLRCNNGPSGVVDVGGATDGVAALPPIAKWKLVGSVNYDVTRQFHVTVQERWRASLKQNGMASLVFAIGDIPSVG